VAVTRAIVTVHVAIRIRVAVGRAKVTVHVAGVRVHTKKRTIPKKIN